MLCKYSGLSIHLQEVTLFSSTFRLVPNLFICNAEIFDALKEVLIINGDEYSSTIFPPNLSYSDEVRLRHPRVKVLTVELQAPIANVKTFRATNGSIETVHLMENLRAVQIYNCSTSEVIINPNWTYQIEDLAIVFNNLEKLPKNLNVLKSLKYLSLPDNKIEFLEMGEFSGMRNLEYIAVQRNKIYEISAAQKNPMFLPNLKIFYAHQNHLIDLSFKHWNATSLQIIYLHENQLQIIPSIENAFPALKKVAIDSNSLNCRWLKETLEKLKQARVKIVDENKTTCNKVGPPLEVIVRKLMQQEAVHRLQDSQIELEKSYVLKLRDLEENNRNLTVRNEIAQKEIDKCKANKAKSQNN